MFSGSNGTIELVEALMTRAHTSHDMAIAGPYRLKGVQDESHLCIVDMGGDRDVDQLQMYHPCCLVITERFAIR